MRNIFRGLVFLVLTGCSFSQDYVPWVDNPAYCRVDTRWYLINSGAPSDLYYNGIFQSSEPGGTGSIDFILAPNKHSVNVGIIDSGNHGAMVNGIVRSICGASIFNYNTDYSPDDIAAGIRWCLNNGCQAINLSWTTSQEGGTMDNLHSACGECAGAGVILVCSVPNANVNIDSPVTPAYPPSWNFPLCVPVTSTTRQDLLFSPAAVGARVVAGPGRIIISTNQFGTEVFGTGTSYAAPMVTGIAAWLLGQFQQTPSVIVQSLYAGAIQIDSRVAGRISMRGSVEALRPFLTITNGIPEVYGFGDYVLDFWRGQEDSGFWRARIK